MKELNEIQVTWQLAVLVRALAALPIAIVILVAVAEEPGQTGGHGAKIFAIFLLVVALVLGAVAIVTRLAAVEDADLRRAVLKKIGIGVLIIAVAAGLSAISYLFGAFSGMGTRFYLIPGGIYAIGLVELGRAMVYDGGE